jgi:hypothetical protein
VAYHIKLLFGVLPLDFDSIAPKKVLELLHLSLAIVEYEILPMVNLTKLTDAEAK